MSRLVAAVAHPFAAEDVQSAPRRPRGGPAPAAAAGASRPGVSPAASASISRFQARRSERKGADGRAEGASSRSSALTSSIARSKPVSWANCCQALAHSGSVARSGQGIERGGQAVDDGQSRDGSLVATGAGP